MHYCFFLLHPESHYIPHYLFIYGFQLHLSSCVHIFTFFYLFFFFFSWSLSSIQQLKRNWKFLFSVLSIRTGLWATWCSGKWPAHGRVGWKQIIVKVSSGPNCSMILWASMKYVCRHKTLLTHWLLINHELIQAPQNIPDVCALIPRATSKLPTC